MRLSSGYSIKGMKLNEKDNKIAKLEINVFSLTDENVCLKNHEAELVMKLAGAEQQVEILQKKIISI